MKITYLQQAGIVKIIHTELSEAKGDLILALYEVEQKLETAFEPCTRRALKLNDELKAIQRKAEKSPESDDRLREIQKEASDIYKKTKELDLPEFEFGTGGPMDIKPYITLAGYRAMKPLLKNHAD